MTIIKEALVYYAAVALIFFVGMVIL